MTVFLSHFSALRFWREAVPLDFEFGRASRATLRAGDAKGAPAAVKELPSTFASYDGKFDLLVGDARPPFKSKNCRCRCWTTDLPSRAFHRFKPGVYVSTPEFVFVQLAAQLDLIELVALGMELCGTYVLVKDPLSEIRWQPDGTGMVVEGDDAAAPKRSRPLTSVARLRNAVEATAGARGHRKALRALRFIVDGSASPYETLTEMFLCLSPLLGGYGIPLPKMNYRVDFDEDVARMARKNKAYCDLAWLDAKLDVEYLGSVHEGAERMQDDASRRDALEMSGYMVVTLSRARIHSIQRFEKVVCKIADRLGKRLHNRVMGSLPGRIEMRRIALRWTAGGGVRPFSADERKNR